MAVEHQPLLAEPQITTVRRLTVYAHLINTDDHAGNMAALGALAGPAENPSYGNVIPLRG